MAMDSKATDITIEHYQRKEVKDIILRYCKCIDGQRGLNASERWYRGGKDPETVMLRGPNDYNDTIERGRPLYATLDLMKESVFQKSEKWISGKTQKDGRPENPIGDLSNCIGFTLSTDIDGIGDIRNLGVKEAVEKAAQFHVDYLKKKGIEKSIYCLYSGGGIYVHVHHGLLAVDVGNTDLTPEKIKEEYQIITKAYNRLIEDISKEFFRQSPECIGKVKFDKLNNQKRTFKVIFSIHKSLPYAVIPLDPKAIKIDLSKASLPLGEAALKSGEDWYKTFSLSEKGPLILLLKEKMEDIRQILKSKPIGKSEISRTETPTLIEKFPPCIKNIIGNAQAIEGRHRALGILATYLYQAGWEEEKAFDLWARVADRCGVEPRIFETEFGRVSCPRCDTMNMDTGGYPNLNLYKLGFCNSNKGCLNILWPGDYGKFIPEAKPKQETLREHTLNNRGNVERLIDLHVKDLKYCREMKDWLHWNGKRWERDETAPYKALDDVVFGLYEDARECDNDDLRKKLAGFAATCGNNSVYVATTALASKNQRFSISILDIDKDDCKMNLNNGILDLKDFRLDPHFPDAYLMKIVAYDFDPDAKCERWEKFLKEVFKNDDALIDYIRRVIGYSLTGSMAEKAFFFLYGPDGDNGKSVFLEVLRALMGDYAKNADISTFLTSKNEKGVRDDLAALYGARIVTTAEPEEGSRFAMNVIKPWTGSDPQTCRELYGKIFTYQPKGKIFLAANNKPAIYERTDAAWSRVHLIPFNVTFSKEKQDKTLSYKLKAELPGILNWAIKGLQDYRVLGGLYPPESVRDAIKAYRRENDSVRIFVEEFCTLEEHANIDGPAMYASYKDFCSGFGLRALGLGKFNGAMLDACALKGAKREKRASGYVWYGINAAIPRWYYKD